MCISSLRQVFVVCSLSALAACSSPLSPDGGNLQDSLNSATADAVQSAAGPWNGIAGGSIQFEFSLSQAPDGRVQGSGTMREAGAGGPVPIAVSGTYHRPNLSLTFIGMVVEGREVSGTFAEAYTSFTGLSGTLRLTADNYARSLPLFLQEGSPHPPRLDGRLTDAITGVPVAGATVTVQGKSVTSSATGHYGFNPNLMAGTFPVTVSHPLYLEVVRNVEIAPFALQDFKLQPK